MNKNITVIILLVLAALAVWWGWGKIQPYLNTGGDTTIDTTTMPGNPPDVPQP